MVGEPILICGQRILKFLSLKSHSHVPSTVEFTENMQRLEAYADTGHHDVTYDVGEHLLLNAKNVCKRALAPQTSA